jgi:hypothetical protein
MRGACYININNSKRSRYQPLSRKSSDEGNISTGRVPDEVLKQRAIQREQLEKELLEKFLQTDSSLLPQEDAAACEVALAITKLAFEGPIILKGFSA